MTNIQHEVSRDELDRHLREIAKEVRLSGSPEERRAFDYIEGQLTGFGYQVTRYESDALIGYPLRAELRVTAPESRQIRANGYSMTPGTGPDGVSGELVDVGAGSEADYAGRDVRGKIVLSDGLATPGKALAAQRAGAAAQLHINDEQIHEMCVSPVWGTPIPETAGLLPAMPAVGINRADGDALRQLLRQGAVQVHLVTETFLDWRKLPTLIAELPGTAEENFVLFSGHVDSWHYGAMDNGTANATQLDVARVLAAHRADLRRGVRVAFWSGHSHGRYAGSAWYADTYWADLHERCVCHVNIDSVGAKGATVLSEAPAMAETYAFAKQILADTIGETLDYRRISRSSDQSFWGHGIPSVLASLSEQARDDSPTSKAHADLLGGGGRGGGLGWWWHTPADTLDKIELDYLVRDAGIYAETLWRLCTLERLPFDAAAAADEIAGVLERDQEAAAGALDLRGVASQARELAKAIRAVDLAKLTPAAANALVLDLCHTLIPVNYTRSGPFEQDLALGSGPLPGLAAVGMLTSLDPESSQFHFLRTRLVRERNRIEQALRTAKKLVAAVE